MPGGLYADHARQFEENLYVYPVLSRRSWGISIGINLNPDKSCNFDCVYCQVDRQRPAIATEVDEDRLMQELETTVELVRSGRIFGIERFAGVPTSLRRLNDIAFSGDGEPTAYPGFERIVTRVADLRRARHLDEVKLVLITNATLLHRPGVERALRTLDASGGEIWAKLDAGTEGYYRAIHRTSVPFLSVQANIKAAAWVRPVVIQSLFLRWQGLGPSGMEVDAYCQKLKRILVSGGRIARVQIYTVARTPAMAAAEPLTSEELKSIGVQVWLRVHANVEIYHPAPALPG